MTMAMSHLSFCSLLIVLLCFVVSPIHAGRHSRRSFDALFNSVRSINQSINQSTKMSEMNSQEYLSATGSSQSGPYSVINNVDDRRDVNGAYMNIHDGKIIQVFDQSINQSMFYYFGASYSNCTEPPGMTGCASDCGFQLNHNVSLFTSSDLINWSPSINQPIMQVARDFPVIGVIMFCPKVLFNPRTNQWVMWFNYDLGGQGYLAVMTADLPHMKWTTVSTRVEMSTVNEGDFNLFQDDNFDAYILYTGRGPAPVNAPMVMVEKLSFDYTSSLGAAYNSGDLHSGVYCEAPAMTKRNGDYLISFGPDCCYCKGGSANTMYASKEPLGPYTSIGTFTSAIPAQQTDMLAFKDHRNETQILWLGDRWQQSPSGEKARDLTYMGILHFDDSGQVEQLVFEDLVEIHVLPNSPSVEPFTGSNSGAVASSSFLPPSDYFGSSSSSSSQWPALFVCNVDTAGSPLVNVTYELNPAITASQIWSFSIDEGGVAVIGSKFDPLPPSMLPFGAQSQYAFMVTSTSSSMSAQLDGTQLDLMYSASFWWAQSDNSTVSFSLHDHGDRVLWKSPETYQGGWIYVVTKPFKLYVSTSKLAFHMSVHDQSEHVVLVNSFTIAVVGPQADGSIVANNEYSFEFPIISSADGAYLYNPPITDYQPFNFTADRGGIASVGSTWDPAPPIQPPSCRQYAYLQNNNNTYSVMSASLTGLKEGHEYHIKYSYSVRSSSQDLGDMSQTGMTQSQMSIFIDNERIYLSQSNLTSSGGWMPVKTKTFKAIKSNSRLAFSVVNLNPAADSSILIDQVTVVEM